MLILTETDRELLEVLRLAMIAHEDQIIDLILGRNGNPPCLSFPLPLPPDVSARLWAKLQDKINMKATCQNDKLESFDHAGQTFTRIPFPTDPPTLARLLMESATRAGTLRHSPTAKYDIKTTARLLAIAARRARNIH